MNATKLLICTVIGAIYMYLLDFAWYVFIVGDGMNPDAPQPHHWAMILGYLIFAAIFSVMYTKGVEPGSATQQGLRFGVMVGLLVALPFGLIMYGVAPAEPELAAWSDLGEVLQGVAYEVVKVIILGVIIAHLSGAHSTNRSKDIDGRGDTSGGIREPQPPPPQSPEGGEN